MKKTIYLVLLPFLIFTGCSTVAHYRSADSAGTDYPSTRPQDVQIYVENNIEKKVIILGPVVASGDAGNDSRGVVDLLKKEAALLGADAIVGMTLEPSIGYWNSAIKATGIAVKFKN